MFGRQFDGGRYGGSVFGCRTGASEERLGVGGDWAWGSALTRVFDMLFGRAWASEGRLGVGGDGA